MAGQVRIQRGIQFGSAGGRALLLDVAAPHPPPQPMPAVIEVHGGGWEEGKRGVAEDSILPNHGFFYASIDYRLSGEAPFPAQIHDVKAAVRWLRAHAGEWHVDPARIGAWGGSAGGHLASLLGLTPHLPELEGESGTPGVSSAVAAVASLSGPADFLDEAWWSWENSADPLRKLFGGNLETRRDAARLASPLAHVSPSAPPFLLVHGDRDETVPVTHAVRLHEALRQVGADSTLHVLGETGHDLTPRWEGCRELLLHFFRRALAS